MPGRSMLSSLAYRYGYQGQFSEKDAETDWNAFKLRMYDANIGRWLSVDPYREFSSSYIGMAGNPVSAMDPDGGRTATGGGGDAPKSSYSGPEIVITGYRPQNNFLGLNNMNNISFMRDSYWEDAGYYAKQKMAYGLNWSKDFMGGVKDFGEQFITMKYLTNFANSDKYFHSKANFNATLRGDGGEYAAEKLSNLREIFDQRIKGDKRIWSLEDQEANRYGRERAKHYRLHGGSINYKEAIPKYRKNSLLDEQGY